LPHTLNDQIDAQVLAAVLKRLSPAAGDDADLNAGFFEQPNPQAVFDIEYFISSPLSL
jgi:hypothetical protein